MTNRIFVYQYDVNSLFFFFFCFFFYQEELGSCLNGLES